MESTQHKGNQDVRLADVFSQPVNSAPPFSTANRSTDTLPIASDDEPGVCGDTEPWGSETRLRANAHAQNRQSAASFSKKLRITSLTQSFSSAKLNSDEIPIASDIEYEQASNGWRDKAQAMGRAKTPTNNLSADNPIATTASVALGSSPMSPTPSAVFQRSFSESASNMNQQAHAKPDTDKMKSALKAKIHATPKPMNTEEKLKYEKLRDLKRKLVSKSGEAGPSSVTRKYSMTPLSYSHNCMKIFPTFVSHRSWDNLRG